MCKPPAYHVDHRSPITWKCSVPKVPWNFTCIFLIEQCSKGWLSPQAIRKAYWIPLVAELEWKCSEAAEAQTSNPWWGSLTDWETGRDSAISCPPPFGRTWQPLSGEREEGLWEWGLRGGKLRSPLETAEEGSMLKGKGGDRKPPLNCL